MKYNEKRKAIRYPFRSNIYYEEILSDNRLDIPITINVKDFSLKGLCFYSNIKLDINARLKVSVLISKDKSVTFEVRVVRVIPLVKTDSGYIIGVCIENVNQDTIEKIESFFYKIDVNNILDNINLENVVDVHLIADYPPVIKKSGKLSINKGEIFDEYVLKNLLINMLDDDMYDKFIKNKELNFIFITRKGMRFRVNLHIQQSKIEATFRLIPTRIDSPSFLGLPKIVEKLLLNTRGLILVAGRTGSGKTTTLSSMIEFINNTRYGMIVCIEDPVEFIHINQKCIIKQREVGKDTLSFFNAAKNALRQNPDILVVGEILDKETMETAITAAETGALVLTSIHAGDSSQALDRVSSFFPADMQGHILKRLSLILKGVIAQELVPRIDGAGLVLATEIMIVSSAIRKTIREADWKQIPSLIQVGSGLGMQTMNNSLKTLYNKGLIDVEYLNDGTF